MHPRIRAPCCVANARDSTGYRCALRLALHPEPWRLLTARIIQSFLSSLEFQTPLAQTTINFIVQPNFTGLSNYLSDCKSGMVELLQAACMRCVDIGHLRCSHCAVSKQPGRHEDVESQPSKCSGKANGDSQPTVYTLEGHTRGLPFCLPINGLGNSVALFVLHSHS